MNRSNTSSKLILIGLILFIVLFVFFLYTFLHEAGHALAGWFYGQSLTEFNVSFWNFEAHVGMVGGALTRSQLALRSAAGTILPILFWTIFISVIPRKANFLLETLKLISSMAVVNTLLTWIVLPILFIFAKAPSDDVTNFLRYSQMPPLLLVFIASSLYVGGWILFLSKIDGLRNEFMLFRTTKRDVLLAGARQTLPGIAGILTVCLVVVFTLNTSASKNFLNKFSPPQDFEPVAQIDLSTRAYPSETLTEFHLETQTYVGVFVAIHNINTAYFDLSVIGPDGFNSTVLHGEGYNAFQDGGLWEENLPPGAYRVVLTSHQSPGTASVHLKIH
jgi:hypothetical protein